MFGCAARNGLSTTAIPKEALNSLVDEDQLQNTLTAMNVSSQPDNGKVVEQTVLNNPITKVCVVCLKECSEDIVCFKYMEPVHISCSEDYVSEDEVEQKICKLCFNELNVQREREKSKKCLEIQAKKIKLMSDKSHSEASVGFTVRIPVPEVDREKGDTKSILAIIIRNTEEGFFQLGTRNGRIKQLYSRSQFSVCEQELIKIEEVPDVEISLRSVATAQSLEEFKLLYGEQKRDRLCLEFGVTANLIIHQAKHCGRKCAEEFANSLNFDLNSNETSTERVFKQNGAKKLKIRPTSSQSLDHFIQFIPVGEGVDKFMREDRLLGGERK
ncbi:uncharacterized protein NPIL_555561 [Nephila pilipes]|uniref:Uncharacterized protein n=1 Tax=Nephila pilipes TaxID=299642 RepID=A0A8X6NT20_NEPPI|nr:uncharacterized protein NPIL_555561 [Nephila pilipes]